MKNFKLNLRKMVSLRGASLILCGAIMATSLTGCGKKSDCEIKENHLHEYVNEDGYVWNIDDEHLSKNGYLWTDKVTYYDKEDKDYYNFIKDKGLLKIEDNQELIDKQESKNKDFIEYRYAYTTLVPIPHFMQVGNVQTVYYTYIPVTHYSWTTDSEHSRLTGEQRLCHYMYQACNIAKGEDGKYVVIVSDYVDNLDEVKDEYPFIKKDYYKAVDVEYGTDLDYEDGPAEDDENYDPEKGTEVEEESTSRDKNALVDEPKKLVLIRQ